jgi:amidase
VTGKLWNDAHDPSAVRPAVEKTLEDLGLSYLDLYLMHWPVAFYPDTVREIVVDPDSSLLQTWFAMEELVREGIVRQIGVCNFNKAQLQQIRSHAYIHPTIHEFETHPYLQQSDFVKWNLQHGIRVIAYSPLGNMNPIYHSSETPMLQDPSLVSLADRKGISVAQLVLAWGMHRGVVVIPKSEHVARVSENLQAQHVRLTAEEIQIIDARDEKHRFNNPSQEWGVELYSGLDGA